MVKISPSNLLKSVGLSHAVSNTIDGNMSLKWGETDDVIQNRYKFLQCIDLELKSTIGGRLDGETDNIEVLGAESAGRGMIKPLNTALGDAIITNDKHLGLFMFAGDCPIAIVFDPITQILGMVHLSRSTSDKGIAAKTVNKLKDHFDCEPKDILVWIGPGIKKESYIYKTYPNTALNWGGYITQTGYGTSIDLFGFNINQFILAGVPKKNIEVSKIDVFTNQDYFSHYRSIINNEPEARFAVIARMPA